MRQSCLTDGGLNDRSFESGQSQIFVLRKNGQWDEERCRDSRSDLFDFTSSDTDAPDGNQVAFVGANGSLRQTLAMASGSHTLNFLAAQAMSVNENLQQVRVSLLGFPTSTKSLVWSGNTIAEERDSSGLNVTKRFFAEGEQRIGGGDAGNYYYTRDHLGSVREVTNATGVLKAQYDYDAWGNQVVVSGNMSFDFGYTGHYRHAASNLYLAPFRAYDPTMGRWLSRDPMGERHHDGPNLYRYSQNDPTNSTDPLGLFTIFDLPNFWKYLTKDFDLSRPFESIADAAWRHEQEDMPGGHGGRHGGAYSHCVANCMFKRAAGSDASRMAVPLLNLSEYFAWDQTSPGDQRANQAGSEAADGPGSCVEECKKKYPPCDN